MAQQRRAIKGRGPTQAGKGRIRTQKRSSGGGPGSQKKSGSRSEFGSSGSNRRGYGVGSGNRTRYRSGSAKTGRRPRFIPQNVPLVPLSSLENPEGQRLQVVLAAAGYGSRRQCEELITTGRVLVDGEVVNKLGVRVLPGQKIMVDGEQLLKNKQVYLVVYKPKGVLCTNSDPTGRPRAIDLVPASFGRLFSVGRLDQNSEGLLLLTNDGTLAQRLTHPRYEVSKKYKVQVAGFADGEIIDQLKKGVHLAEAVVQADEVVFKARYKNSSILEIVLREGKNREIRRMLARMGHKVLRLQRTAIGPIKLGKMVPGEYRILVRDEVDKLYQAAGIKR